MSNLIQRLYEEAQDDTTSLYWQAAQALEKTQGAKPVAWLAKDGSGVISDADKQRLANNQGIVGAHAATKFSIPLYTQPAAKVPGDFTSVRTETLKWLLGEGGEFEPPKWQREQNERVYGKIAPYWWRHHLRDAMLTTPQQSGECNQCGGFAYECDELGQETTGD